MTFDGLVKKNKYKTKKKVLEIAIRKGFLMETKTKKKHFCYRPTIVVLQLRGKQILVFI